VLGICGHDSEPLGFIKCGVILAGRGTQRTLFCVVCLFVCLFGGQGSFDVFLVYLWIGENSNRLLWSVLNFSCAWRHYHGNFIVRPSLSKTRFRLDFINSKMRFWM
jgi:hypothetical protein